MRMLRTGMRGVAGGWLAGWVVIVLVNTALAAPQRPNILLILTDDQGWPTLGSYGGAHVATPHLDRLAEEGMRLTDAYVMPQCTPTRASLLTGQHTARNGMWHVIGWYGYPWAPVGEPTFREQLSRETFTLAKGLRAAGYATACIGKWHLTNNADGHYVHLRQAAATHYGFDVSPDPPHLKYHQEGDKGVGWLTDQAISFMTERRDEPWFVYLAHHTIHGPVVAPEEIVARYRDRGAPEEGLFNASYLAAIETLDTSVGRLLKAVDESGQRNETLVVFLSDNGGVHEVYDPFQFRAPAGPVQRLRVTRREYSNAPLRAGKGSPYEGGIRVPCLVRWPGIVEPGSVVSTPVHVVDWLPTLLAAGRATVPATHAVDGVNLIPLLRGGMLPPRALYWYLPLYDLRWGGTPCAVIREGRWKLIHFFGDRVTADGTYAAGEAVELYDLENDLGERRDLSKTRPEVTARLIERLDKWMMSIPAERPGPNPHFDPAQSLWETREKPPWLLP